jgi:hypothetical protein
LLWFASRSPFGMLLVLTRGRLRQLPASGSVANWHLLLHSLPAEDGAHCARALLWLQARGDGRLHTHVVGANVRGDVFAGAGPQAAVLRLQ